MSAIRQQFLNAVVSLGSGDVADPVQEGSAFLVAVPDDLPSVQGKRGGRGYLVTNRHVAEYPKDLVLHLNAAPDERGKRLELKAYAADDDPIWVAHPDPAVDVAVTGAVHGWLNQNGYDAARDFIPMTMALSSEQWTEFDVGEGDPIFALGYPIGTGASGLHHSPIVRGGCIAQLEPFRRGESDRVFLDCEIYPGNSGGPVFLAPHLEIVDESVRSRQIALFGIVISVTVMEHSIPVPDNPDIELPAQAYTALSTVHPIDYIVETIREHDRRFPAARK